MVVAADKEGLAMAERMMASQDGSREVVEGLKKQQDELSQTAQALDRKLAELHDMQDKLESGVQKFKKSLKELGGSNATEEEAKELYSSLRSFQTSMPITGGPFVELFLGKMDVRFRRKKERLQFKKEYELFKQKLSFVFVGLAIISLLLNVRWVHMGLQLCLSYYYVTIAIRENILRENGSNIKSWWIQHHYLMVGCGVVLVTWPPSKSYRLFCYPLHFFGLYTSILQIFQTRYQMSRLYTLLALGKAGEMDIVNTDSSHIHWSESMKFILPMVLFGHMFQLYLSLFAFRIFVTHPKDLHPLLVSGFNMAMFLGNFSTTLRIVLEKARGKKSQDAVVIKKRA